MRLRYADLWAALDAIAAENELRVSGLAKAAGLDPSAFNKSKRMRPNGEWRSPATQSIAAVLDATHLTFMDFAAMVEANERCGEGQPRLLLTSGYTAGASTSSAGEGQNANEPDLPMLSKPYRQADLARAVRDVLTPGEVASRQP